jgi:hypothetical protein
LSPVIRKPIVILYAATLAAIQLYYLICVQV